MEVPVIIEPVAWSGFHAPRAGGLSAELTAGGATPAEAVHRLAAQVVSRLGGRSATFAVSSTTIRTREDVGMI